MRYFCILLIRLAENSWVFRVFGRKTQSVGKFCEDSEFFDENTIEKLNFYLFFIFFKNIIYFKYSLRKSPYFSTTFSSVSGWISALSPPLLIRCNTALEHSWAQPGLFGRILFRKFWKNQFSENCQNEFLACFSKQVIKTCYKSLRFWIKTVNDWEILRKHSQVFKNFL